MRSCLAFALVLVLAGCGRLARSAPSAIVVQDSAGITIVENDLAGLSASCSVAPTPTVTIGVTEGAEEYQLHRVFGASRLSDGRIVLVNQGSQQIRFYDQQGRFLSAGGRPGEGPGEFRDAFYLWVLPGDSIWVGDYDPWQFLVFGPDAKWVRTVRPTPHYLNSPDAMIVLADGRSVLGTRPIVAPSTRFELRHVTLLVHGPDGARLDSLGSYPDGRWGHVETGGVPLGLFPLFESFTRLAGGGSRVVIGHTSEPELFVHEAGQGFRPARIVRWTTDDRTVSSADVQTERQRINDRYKDLDPARRSRLVEPLVSDARPVADRFPAFVRVQVGRDGRIWVQEYPRPTAPEPHRWIAFDVDGRFQCRATLPAFEELLEFGADYLLAKDPGELGVERVVQYSITGPSPED